MRTDPSEPTDTAEQAPIDRPRRGRKPRMDAVPTEDGSRADVSDVADGDTRVEVVLAEPEPPAKARRGRKPKSQAGLEPSATGAKEMLTSSKRTNQARSKPGPRPADARSTTAADTASEGMPPTMRRGRKPKAQPAAEPAPVHDHQPQHASALPAAHWDPASGTATFDWPAIERVAEEGGANKAIAKLLLAARAEGANSRWPF